jgi:hypothetical protein
LQLRRKPSKLPSSPSKSASALRRWQPPQTFDCGSVELLADARRRSRNALQRAALADLQSAQRQPFRYVRYSPHAVTTLGPVAAQAREQKWRAYLTFRFSLEKSRPQREHVSATSVSPVDMVAVADRTKFARGLAVSLRTTKWRAEPGRRSAKATRMVGLPGVEPGARRSSTAVPLRGDSGPRNAENPARHVVGWVWGLTMPEG